MSANGASEWTEPPGGADVRDLAPPGSAIADLLRHAPSVIEQLPVLHGLPQRILATIHDPVASMDDVAQLIAQDPGTSVRILKIANSAYYGGNQHIESLPLACSRLGIRTVANLVVAMGARSCFVSADSRFQDLLEEQWEHAVVTAHAAQKLEKLVNAELRDSLFSAGLLHDVGKVVLIQLIANPGYGAPDGLRRSDTHVKDALSHFHALCGLHVAVRNNLHDSLRVAMYYHHKPQHVEAETLKAFVYALVLANNLAHEAGYGGAGTASIAEDPAAEFFGIGPVRREEIAQAIQAEAAGVVEALSMV